MRATALNLELPLMQCACAFDWANLPASFSATAVSFLIILWHTRPLPLCLPPSAPAFFYPSLPPSLSRWPLPARWPQGKLPQLRNAVLLHCNAPLRPASFHPYSTHIWTRANTHTHTHTYTVDMRSDASMHAHKTPPHTHRGCVTPSPPLTLPLYQPLHSLFLLAIVLPP